METPIDVAVSAAPNDCRHCIHAQSFQGDVSEDEREPHANDRDEGSDSTHKRERPQVGLESDLEQQNQQAELRQDLYCWFVRMEDAEHRRSENHSAEQLAKNGRLTKFDYHHCQQPRRDQYRGDHQKQLYHRCSAAHR